MALFEVRVVQDENAPNPRIENDNVDVMCFQHRRYELGDKDARDAYDENRKLYDDVAIVLPVYMIDHSGLALSHTPFSCPWDSGQLGVHYITKTMLQDAFKGDKALARKYMAESLKEYDAWQRGDVWEVQIDIDGTHEGTHYFHYGDDCLADMQSEVSVPLHPAVKEAWDRRFEGHTATYTSEELTYYS